MRHDNATPGGVDDDSDGNGDDKTIRDITSLLAMIGIDDAASAAMVTAKARGKMARVQRLLYQEKVARAVKDAVDGVDHSSHMYTFVVDFGQNMELPIYNNEQPGCTYYFSPLSV